MTGHDDLTTSEAPASEAPASETPASARRFRLPVIGAGLAVAALLVGAGVFGLGQGGPAPAEAATKEDVLASSAFGRPGDIVMGDPDAPVEIIEYASMTCGHCAAFHNENLEPLKENYIETGKVYYVFR